MKKNSDDVLVGLAIFVLVCLPFFLIDFAFGEQVVEEAKVIHQQVDNGRYLVITKGETETRIYTDIWMDLEVGQTVVVSKWVGCITNYGYRAKILGE